MMNVLQDVSKEVHSNKMKDVLIIVQIINILLLMMIIYVDYVKENMNII